MPKLHSTWFSDSDISSSTFSPSKCSSDFSPLSWSVLVLSCLSIALSSLPWVSSSCLASSVCSAWIGWLLSSDCERSSSLFFLFSDDVSCRSEPSTSNSLVFVLSMSASVLFYLGTSWFIGFSDSVESFWEFSESSVWTNDVAKSIWSMVSIQTSKWNH